MKLDINIGDVLLTGRFKNKHTKIKSLGRDELGQPTFNKGKKLLSVRIEKRLPEKMWSSKTLAEKYKPKEKDMDKKAYENAFVDELNKIACGDMLQYFKDHPEKLKEKLARDKAKKATITKTAEPTEAQKKAGNYKKKHIRYNGMEISIENPAGSVRRGKSPDGKEWSSHMYHHYGYIRKTLGRDKDQIDVFIKPGTKETEKVYIINQTNKEKKFDEHKCMLGFTTEIAAKRAYLMNYEKGWDGLGSIVEMPIKEFKKWVYSGRKMGPAKTVKEKVMNKKAFLKDKHDSAYKEELKKISSLSGNPITSGIAAGIGGVYGGLVGLSKSQKKTFGGQLLDSLKWAATGAGVGLGLRHSGKIKNLIVSSSKNVKGGVDRAFNKIYMSKAKREIDKMTRNIEKGK